MLDTHRIQKRLEAESAALVGFKAADRVLEGFKDLKDRVIFA